MTFFPTTQRCQSYAHNSSHSSPPQHVLSTPMTYFNYFNNTNLHPIATNPNEFGAHALLNQMSANEQENFQTFDPFAGDWSLPHPGNVAGSPTNPHVVNGFSEDSSSLFVCRHLTCASSEPVPSVTSHDGQTHSYAQSYPEYYGSSYPEYYWPTTDQRTQSHHFSVATWDDHFTNTIAPEAPMVFPTPSSGKCPFLCTEEPSAHHSRTVPFDYWGGNQSGQSTSAFRTVSPRAQSSHP